MTRYLLATASVHTTAAAADYLGDRLDPADEVVVVTVDEPDLPDRDRGDAANVARSRLLPASVDVVERAGEPAAEIRAVLAQCDVDELVVGTRRDDAAVDAAADAEGDASAGSTARRLLGAVDVPVVVVPVSNRSG